MNLVAALIVRNEIHRYLDACLENLAGFCDGIAVMDDCSDNGTYEYLTVDPRITRLARTVNGPTFYKHEGRTRQALLDLTLLDNPTHVLNIDADELVDDGAKVRTALEAQPDVPYWSLSIEEVRTAKPDGLLIREDGGWRSHPLNVLWKVPADPSSLKIMDRKLACRRVPTAVWQGKAQPTGASLLHFGWTDPAERKRRYDRYMDHDRGRFHAIAHLKSCVWADGDPRMKLRQRDWPAGAEFDGLRERFASVTT